MKRFTRFRFSLVRRQLIYWTGAFAMLAIGSFFVEGSPAEAAVPTTMNFQGRLTDSTGTVMPNGLYNMRLRIYTAASGGTQLWTETRETSNRVQVTNGLFSVQIGSVTPLTASIFNNASTLYFEIELPTPATATCSTASCQAWTEGAMTPRSVIAASAYAFNAASLDGFTASGFIQNQSAIQQSASSFWLSGSGQADTAFLTPRLDTASAGALTLGNTNATSIAIGKVGVGTTANGTLTATGLLTGNAGATVSGAVTLNTSGANAVSINTGSATGTTSIGNSAAGAISVQSASTVEITGTTTVSGLASGTGVALSVTNSTSTGSILELKDSTTSVFTVADGGAVVAKNTSTTAFAIQNASGYSVLTADTSTNYRLVLGTPGGDTTGTLLVLGNKTNEGDPTGVEGAMYYNSSMKSFRCYRDGMWDDCSTHNIERQWVVEDEFFSGHNFFDVAPGGYFDGEIGSLNWHGYVFGGSGTVTLRHNSAYVQPTADRPGTLNLIATAVDTGATVFLGDDEDDAGLGYAVRLAAGNVFKTAVKAEYANFDGYMGLHNQRKTGGTPTEGIWFGVDSSTDRWQLCYYGKRLSGDSNGAQCLTTGVSTSTNWTRLEFRIVSLTTGAVTIDYYIDGVKYTPTSNGSIYSVVSTNGVTPAIQFENDRSGSAQMAIDYVQVRGTSSAAR